MILQIFIGMLGVISVFKLCVEGKINELEGVRIQRTEEESRISNTEELFNDEKTLNEEVNDEDMESYDSKVTEALSVLFDELKAENMALQIRSDSNEGILENSKEIMFQGDLSLDDFYGILRKNKKMKMKLELNSFKLIFIQEEMIRCSAYIKIF